METCCGSDRSAVSRSVQGRFGLGSGGLAGAATTFPQPSTQDKGHFLIEESRVVRQRIRLQGCFGEVSLGVLDGQQTVVLKELDVPGINPHRLGSLCKTLLERLPRLTPHHHVRRVLGMLDSPSQRLTAVMEYCGGCSLEEALAVRGLTQGRRLEVARGAVEGLRKLHNQGIVHGAFATRNILIWEAPSNSPPAPAEPPSLGSQPACRLCRPSIAPLDPGVLAMSRSSSSPPVWRNNSGGGEVGGSGRGRMGGEEHATCPCGRGQGVISSGGPGARAAGQGAGVRTRAGEEADVRAGCWKRGLGGGEEYGGEMAVCVSDYGLAMHMQERLFRGRGASGVAASRGVAPELMRAAITSNVPVFNKASDVYSVGWVLCDIFSQGLPGHHPEGSRGPPKKAGLGTTRGLTTWAEAGAGGGAGAGAGAGASGEQRDHLEVMRPNRSPEISELVDRQISDLIRWCLADTPASRPSIEGIAQHLKDIADKARPSKRARLNSSGPSGVMPHAPPPLPASHSSSADPHQVELLSSGNNSAGWGSPPGGWTPQTGGGQGVEGSGRWGVGMTGGAPQEDGRREGVKRGGGTAKGEGFYKGSTGWSTAGSWNEGGVGGLVAF